MTLPPKWRVAEAIKQFHRQTRPYAPTAPATSFGTVADAAHTTTSQHYPKVYPGLGPIPVVCAGDIPRAGRLYPRAVLDAIRRSRDNRVLYAISEGQMFSSYATSGYPAWTWRPYTGADKHFDHGHLSVVGDARADDARPWLIGDQARTESTSLATPEEDDMLRDEQVPLYKLDTKGVAQPNGTGNAAEVLGYTNTAAWIAADGVKALAAKVDTLLARDAVSLTDAQVAVLAAQVATAVTTAHAGLTDADTPIIVAAVKQALREGAGA